MEEETTHKYTHEYFKTEWKEDSVNDYDNNIVLNEGGKANNNESRDIVKPYSLKRNRIKLSSISKKDNLQSNDKIIRKNNYNSFLNKKRVASLSINNNSKNILKSAIDFNVRSNNNNIFLKELSSQSKSSSFNIIKYHKENLIVDYVTHQKFSITNKSCLICLDSFDYNGDKHNKFDLNENNGNKTYTVDDEIIFLKCGHYFHKLCFLSWFNTKPSCPLCKESLEHMYLTYNNNLKYEIIHSFDNPFKIVLFSLIRISIYIALCWLFSSKLNIPNLLSIGVKAMNGIFEIW